MRTRHGISSCTRRPCSGLCVAASPSHSRLRTVASYARALSRNCGWIRCWVWRSVRVPRQRGSALGFQGRPSSHRCRGGASLQGGSRRVKRFRCKPGHSLRCRSGSASGCASAGAAHLPEVARNGSYAPSYRLAPRAAPSGPLLEPRPGLRAVVPDERVARDTEPRRSGQR